MDLVRTHLPIMIPQHANSNNCNLAPPTHREALQAMLVLCKYMKVLNYPLARTVEMNLRGFFAWKIHRGDAGHEGLIF